MNLSLPKWLSRFQRRDVDLKTWLNTLPDETVESLFASVHETLGIGRDKVPNVREMSDLEFEDYIALLQRSKRL